MLVRNVFSLYLQKDEFAINQIAAMKTLEDAIWKKKSRHSEMCNAIMI